MLDLPGEKNNLIFNDSNSKDQGINAKKITNAVSVPGYAFMPSIQFLGFERNVDECWLHVNAALDIPAGQETTWLYPISLDSGKTLTSLLLRATGNYNWTLRKVNKTGGETILVSGTSNTRKHFSVVLDNENFIYSVQLSIPVDCNLFSMVMEYN